MFDIITFGSATFDTFLYSKNFKTAQKKNKKEIFLFNLGSKIEIDKILFSTGGGATNTAVAFSKMGHKVACVSKIGLDIGGQEVQAELKKERVETKFIAKVAHLHTAFSVILSIPEKGRTILVFRGASGKLKKEDIPWSDLKTKWIYVASLGGKFNLLKKIINFAYKKRIKIALNPGSKELKFGWEKFVPLLGKINILFLNQEEAAQLTNLPFLQERAIISKLSQTVSGIVVMTQGARGVTVCEGQYIYQAGILPGRVLERTGAGDAFGSGFVSGMIFKDSIEYAIQLGSANSTSVIKRIGAKSGLLSKKDLKYFKKLKVKKYRI